MDQQINGALERIENPILIILLVVLMAAVIALWLRDSSRQEIMFALLRENIGAVKDTAAELGRLNDRLEEIENRLPSSAKA